MRSDSERAVDVVYKSISRTFKTHKVQVIHKSLERLSYQMRKEMQNPWDT